MSELSELLGNAIEQRGLSLRQLSSNARELGYTLSHSTISRLQTGTTRKLDEATMDALSAVLPVRVTDLRAAAGLPAGEEEPYAAPPEFGRLSYRQRALLNELIGSFVNTEEKVDAQEISEPIEDPRGKKASRPAGGTGDGRAPIADQLDAGHDTDGDEPDSVPATLADAESLMDENTDGDEASTAS